MIVLPLTAGLSGACQKKALPRDACDRVVHCRIASSASCRRRSPAGSIFRACGKQNRGCKGLRRCIKRGLYASWADGIKASARRFPHLAIRRCLSAFKDRRYPNAELKKPCGAVFETIIGRVATSPRTRRLSCVDLPRLGALLGGGRQARARSACPRRGLD